MSKKLFSMVSISSVLFSGAAFSMEEYPVVKIKGASVMLTPQTKAKVDEFHERYERDTPAYKDRVKGGLGDLSAVSIALAGVITDRELKKAEKKRTVEAHSVVEFATHRKSERAHEENERKTELQLQMQLNQIRALRELKNQESEKNKQEIASYLEQIEGAEALKLSIESRLQEVTDKLSQTMEQSEASKVEAKEIAQHLTRSLEEVDDEIRRANEQLHQAKLEKIALSAEVKRLALENKRNKALLEEAQSPQKAPRQGTSASSSVTASLANPVLQEVSGDEESDDSEVDLDD